MNAMDDAEDLLPEEGVTVRIHLGDAPGILNFFNLDDYETEQFQELVTEVEYLRAVDEDLRRLADLFRGDAPVPPGRGLLDALRTHCNSVVIEAPKDFEEETREIGLQGQELMRDVRDGFAPGLAPEYIRRAEALRKRIATASSPTAGEHGGLVHIGLTAGEEGRG